MHVKGKAIPLQAWTGPEGSRRLIYAKLGPTVTFSGVHKFSKNAEATTKF
jgi:hypothetical protein